MLRIRPPRRAGGPVAGAGPARAQRDLVPAERLVDRLEERRAARRAVPRAAGGEALGLDPRGAVGGGHVRAARVAGLGADAGAGEPGDDVPAAVVDGLIHRLDRPAVPA